MANRYEVVSESLLQKTSARLERLNSYKSWKFVVELGSEFRTDWGLSG